MRIVMLITRFAGAILVLTLAAAPAARAVTPIEIWRASGSPGVRDLKVDPSNGDIVATGLFSGTLDFDPGSGTTELEEFGGLDVFVMRLSASGALEWALSLGSFDDDNGNGVAVDTAGNVLVTGGFSSFFDFDPGPGTSYEISNGAQDAFVIKYDADGNYLWSIAYGDTNQDWGTSVTVGSGGNILVSGFFSGTVDFDPGAGTANLTSTFRTGYVLSLDASGNFQWVRAFIGDDSMVARYIAEDSTGDLLVSGDFNGTIDFDPGAGTANLTSTGFEDIFVAKLDSGGNYEWAGAMGGAETDFPWQLAVDSTDSVLITGQFSDTADFDPGAGTDTATAFNNSDCFVVKLNPAGTLAWTYTVGSLGGDSAISIATFANDDVLVGGANPVFSTADFDPGPGVATIPAAGFALRLDTDGNFVEVDSMGAIAYRVTVNNSDIGLVAGQVNSFTRIFELSESAPVNAAYLVVVLMLAGVMVLAHRIRARGR